MPWSSWPNLGNVDQGSTKDNTCESRSSRSPLRAVGICCWILRLVASRSWRAVPSSSALRVLNLGRLGFEILSYQGYDVTGHLRAVDYGNYEYLSVLEFWSLREPKIWESLNSMRDAWATLLDLWHAANTQRHVERLADIVEIVMGALRGEDWFHECIGEKRLPDLFASHVALCRLVQLLNARLTTEYLKYKREPLTKFEMPCMFSQLWRDSGYSSGLLLCGLLRAAEQIG